MTIPPQLKLLEKLIGTWTTEATHPAMPGLTVHGSAQVEWLEGERFLIIRSRTDHPKFPDAISIIGFMDDDRVGQEGATAVDAPEGPMRMHYFDSRGVFRAQETSVDEREWKWWRIAPGFSQQFTGTFTDDGNTIDGLCKLRRDDVHWADDLRITYRRNR